MELLGRVLLVEDDPAVVKAICLALRPTAVEVDAIGDPSDLAETLVPGRYDAAVLDMNFRPGKHDGRAGIEAIGVVRAADPALAIVMLTVFGGVALAVEALKRGASDFLLKPWRNDRLIEALRSAVELTRAQRAGAAMSLDEMERHAIERALHRHDGNISKAASALGLTRPALYRRLEKHGL